MKTKSKFELTSKCIIRFSCGTLSDFVYDICEYIVPILEDSIIAEFNGRTVVVSCYDSQDTLYQKFKRALE